MSKYHLYKFSFEAVYPVVERPNQDDHVVTEQKVTRSGVWTCVCRHDEVAQARFQELMKHRDHTIQGIQKEAIDCMLLEIVQ